VLRLRIQDDGRGIDPVAPMGHGLRGMQERVRALSGDCVVESTPGGGTCVRIDIPIEAGRANLDTAADAGAA
jgi:two-component system sensor histidine kinase UhpB